MFLTKSLRRFVARAAAVLLLACQGMSIAHASSPAVPKMSAGLAQESCHEAGGKAGKSAGDNCHSQCKIQNASSTPSTLIYSTIDLPAIAAAFDPIVTVVKSAPPVASRLARIEPPPHSILHCCLRN